MERKSQISLQENHKMQDVLQLQHIFEVFRLFTMNQHMLL